MEAAKKYAVNNEQIGASIREFLGTHTGQYANWRPICEMIPKGSQFVGASRMVGDGHRGVSKCSRDGNGDRVCGAG